MCQLRSNGSACHAVLNEVFIQTRLGGNECSGHLAVSSVSVGVRCSLRKVFSTPVEASLSHSTDGEVEVGLCNPLKPAVAKGEV